MPKKLHGLKSRGLNKDNKDMAKISICCMIVCLILCLLFMIIQKYAMGNDNPFSFIGM